ILDGALRGTDIRIEVRRDRSGAWHIILWIGCRRFGPREVEGCRSVVLGVGGGRRWSQRKVLLVVQVDGKCRWLRDHSFRIGELNRLLHDSGILPGII